MTTRYVGPGGNNTNDGLSWANRKLTLNGVEDTPVVAGDTVYVGPGIYRELLTCDVDGSSGNPITYIADVTGENTDGIGGVVTISASDNDLTKTRSTAVSAAKAYRTFRGFHLDFAGFSAAGASYLNIEDCYYTGYDTNLLYIGHALASNVTARRCIAIHNFSYGRPIHLADSTTYRNNTNILVENCLFIGGDAGVYSLRFGGVTVRNCTIMGSGSGIFVSTLDTGQTVTVENCIISNCSTGINGGTVGMVLENYNSIYGCNTARSNCNTGANSNTYSACWQPKMLLSGRKSDYLSFMPSSRSGLARITGSNAPSEDLFGIARPTTTSRRSWGAIQYNPVPVRDTVNARSGACLKLPSEGFYDLEVPVTDNVAITVSAYVKWDDNTNIGSKPSVKLLADYGVSEQTDTATGDGSTYEQLSVGPVTPQVGGDGGGRMVLRLLNNSTYTSDIAVYFDDVTVT